jgi:adenosylcobinamide-GDP ribazoletransferase
MGTKTMPGMSLPDEHALPFGLSSFLAAVSLLTVIPIHFREPPSPLVMARSRYWFPVVGLLLGGIVGSWAILVGWYASSLLSAFLVLLVWVGLTGALHVDGFCDLCDGLFGGPTPEDRLRILRDPHLGTFGLVGGVLLLLGKLVLIHEALTQLPGRAVWVLIAAAIVGRCLVLVMAAGEMYPRSQGKARDIVESTGWQEAGIAALITATGTLFLSVPALLVVLGLKRLCRRRLTGITGDCLGAAIESAEVVFLLAAVLILPRIATGG